MTGDVDLYKDESKKNDVITKVKNTSWTEFYLSDHWPHVLDEHSRLFFPFAFVIFNAAYWVTAMNNTNTLAHANST